MDPVGPASAAPANHEANKSRTTTSPVMRPEIIGSLIPIVAIVMGIGIAMLSIFLSYMKRKETFELYHRERMAALDKGLEVPPMPEAFFREEHRHRSPHRRLLSGLVLCFLGITLFIALYFNSRRAALYALIPIGVGLAHLIYYFMVGRKEAEALCARAQDAQDATAAGQKPATEPGPAS